jgi:putative peptidoglycan lipid II flippase
VAAQNSQNRAVEFSILLTLPAACALFVMADPVVKVLFQRGMFGDIQASATAAALSIFALGLPAYVLIKSLAPGFFGRGDTVTPVKIAAVAMIVNVILSVILMNSYLHVGIAMATTASSWLNACVMALILYRRGHFVFDDRLKSRIPRTLFASIGMSLALYFALASLAPWLSSAEEFERAFALATLVAGGIASFGALALISGAVERSDIKLLH